MGLIGFIAIIALVLTVLGIAISFFWLICKTSNAGFVIAGFVMLLSIIIPPLFIVGLILMGMVAAFSPSQKQIKRQEKRRRIDHERALRAAGGFYAYQAQLRKREDEAIRRKQVYEARAWL